MGSGSGDSTERSDGLAVERRDAVLVIRLPAGDLLDAYETARLADPLRAVIAAEETPRVVFDLSGAGHLSSAALGMLVGIRHDAVARGGVIRCAAASPSMREILRLSRLHVVLPMDATVEESIERCRAGGSA